ncbi:MAG: hypothetical protein HQK53_06335 [Oligoflexia bacterium]|nr:hypothetical protein [Oligoflexia bacterium]
MVPQAVSAASASNAAAVMAPPAPAAPAAPAAAHSPPHLPPPSPSSAASVSSSSSVGPVVSSAPPTHSSASAAAISPPPATGTYVTSIIQDKGTVYVRDGGQTIEAKVAIGTDGQTTITANGKQYTPNQVIGNSSSQQMLAIEDTRKTRESHEERQKEHQDNFILSAANDEDCGMFYGALHRGINFLYAMGKYAPKTQLLEIPNDNAAKIALAVKHLKFIVYVKFGTDLLQKNFVGEGSPFKGGKNFADKWNALKVTDPDKMAGEIFDAKKWEEYRKKPRTGAELTTEPSYKKFEDEELKKYAAERLAFIEEFKKQVEGKTPKGVVPKTPDEERNAKAKIDTNFANAQSSAALAKQKIDQIMASQNLDDALARLKELCAEKRSTLTSIFYTLSQTGRSPNIDAVKERIDDLRSNCQNLIKLFTDKKTAQTLTLNEIKGEVGPIGGEITEIGSDIEKAKQERNINTLFGPSPLNPIFAKCSQIILGPHSGRQSVPASALGAIDCYRRTILNNILGEGNAEKIPGAPNCDSVNGPEKLKGLYDQALSELMRLIKAINCDINMDDTSKADFNKYVSGITELYELAVLLLNKGTIVEIEGSDLADRIAQKEAEATKIPLKEMEEIKNFVETCLKKYKGEKQIFLHKNVFKTVNAKSCKGDPLLIQRSNPCTVANQPKKSQTGCEFNILLDDKPSKSDGCSARPALTISHSSKNKSTLDKLEYSYCDQNKNFKNESRVIDQQNPNLEDVINSLNQHHKRTKNKHLPQALCEKIKSLFPSQSAQIKNADEIPACFDKVDPCASISAATAPQCVGSSVTPAPSIASIASAIVGMDPDCQEPPIDTNDTKTKEKCTVNVTIYQTDDDDVLKQKINTDISSKTFTRNSIYAYFHEPSLCKIFYTKTESEICTQELIREVKKVAPTGDQIPQNFTVTIPPKYCQKGSNSSKSGSGSGSSVPGSSGGVAGAPGGGGFFGGAVPSTALPSAGAARASTAGRR